MKTWSRLDGLVLFYHTGHAWNYAVTGSFKVLPLRFESAKLARALPQGWYRLARRLANTRIVVRFPEELEPVSDMELAKIGWRMRIRFGKLLKKVKATKRRKIADRIIIAPFRDVVFLTDQQNWYIYVLVPTDGAMSIRRIPRSGIFEVAKGREDEHVVIYLADTYAGIIHFPPGSELME